MAKVPVILPGTFLEDALEKPPANSERFNHRHPRVSNIGQCGRLEVARMLGQAPPANVHPYYERLGKVYQSLFVQDLEERGFTVYEDTARTPLSLFTGVTVDGDPVDGHPDVWFTPPRLAFQEPEVCGDQVKTVEDEDLPKLDRPKPAAEKQARLEWALWHGKEAVWKDHTGVKRLSCPTRYFVTYIGRQSAGLDRRHFELKWDQKQADALVAEFLSRAEHRERGVLPPRPFARPTAECSWNYGEGRGKWVCPLAYDCWGYEL